MEKWKKMSKINQILKLQTRLLERIREIKSIYIILVASRGRSGV